MIVQRVHVDGIGRTKDDLLTYEIADVFKAKNLIDVSILASIIQHYKFDNAPLKCF